MIDREKVIIELEQCLDDSIAAVVPADTVRAAITLLKAQEPKTVQVIGNVGVSDVKFADCPWCAMRIHDDESQCYCGHCGMAVKWE